ncbi:SDR family NAD(P)-dependent oxidoreductase [Aestuariivirga sp.]|uniref:SDR family NAD(P)-dependent oxidoreductase n=1 Tax=Aestuariivirga sp. TaxID=2650926 RepID=UPI0039E607C5
MTAKISQDLSGRVALVTGASRGMGRDAAIALAARGARVLGVARDREQLATLADTPGITTMVASLAEPGACAQVFAAARDLGPVTLLVHAAGRGGYMDKPIFDESLSSWRETMAINLDSAFELCHVVSRDIREEKWGRIVLISSTAGEVGAPSMSPYCASKHGVIGLMRSVAQDLAPVGGTCNAILPGWVRTDMAERDAEVEAERRKMTVEAVWAERAAANPAGRIVRVDEVTSTITFLASPASSGINGQAITVSLGSLW